MPSSRNRQAPPPLLATSSPSEVSRRIHAASGRRQAFVALLRWKLAMFATRTMELSGRRIAQAAHHRIAPGEAGIWLLVWLAVLFDLVDIVVARAGIADQLPAGKIAIAAVDRIGEKSFFRVLPEQPEEIGGGNFA